MADPGSEQFAALRSRIWTVTPCKSPPNAGPLFASEQALDSASEINVVAPKLKGFARY